MNRRDLPLNALRAFEAAARALSVSKAADELGVTHSAISHQIKRLEDVLGQKLFIRNNRGLDMTVEGLRLFKTAAKSFDLFSNTLDQLRDINPETNLRVTCTPTFATRWLIPRLSNGYQNSGACRIHVLPDLDLLDFQAEQIDLAIRCGFPPWKNLRHQLLSSIHLVPVCSPEHLKHLPAVTEVSDLLSLNLIHADVGDHGLGDEWTDWFNGCGIKPDRPLSGLSFHDPALAMQAAADGLGVAIGYHELILDDLKSGKLVIAVDQPVKHAFSYYLVTRKNCLPTHPMHAFSNWLLDNR
ncbi:MAG: LysR family glycine cleavage system transcriptional activator [Gammaproteobacteria bacterium]|jgi:LysR family glycine cleavage system transcriptional activator